MWIIFFKGVLAFVNLDNHFNYIYIANKLFYFKTQNTIYYNIIVLNLPLEYKKIELGVRQKWFFYHNIKLFLNYLGVDLSFSFLRTNARKNKLKLFYLIIFWFKINKKIII